MPLGGMVRGEGPSLDVPRLVGMRRDKCEIMWQKNVGDTLVIHSCQADAEPWFRHRHDILDASTYHVRLSASHIAVTATREMGSY